MSSKTLTFYKCTVWVYSPICFFLLSPAKWGHHLLHSKGEKEPQALWVFLRGFPGSDVAFVLVLFIIRFGKCQGRAKLALLHWKRETNHTCQVNRVQPMFVEGLLYGGGASGWHGQNSLYGFPSHNPCRSTLPACCLLPHSLTSKS